MTESVRYHQDYNVVVCFSPWDYVSTMNILSKCNRQSMFATGLSCSGSTCSVMDSTFLSRPILWEGRSLIWDGISLSWHGIFLLWIGPTQKTDAFCSETVWMPAGSTHTYIVICENSASHSFLCRVQHGDLTCVPCGAWDALCISHLRSQTRCHLPRDDEYTHGLYHLWIGPLLVETKGLNITLVRIHWTTTHWTWTNNYHPTIIYSSTDNEEVQLDSHLHHRLLVDIVIYQLSE